MFLYALYGSKNLSLKNLHYQKFYDWQIPSEENYNSNDYKIYNYKLCVYEPCYLHINRSSVEIEFEKFLENQLEVIEFWYKNGDNGRNYFGIKYIKDDFPYTFYPDYIIKFKDNRIGIFDTKAGITAETAKEKADSLQNFIVTENEKGLNLFGGIVIIDNSKQFRINEQPIFEFNKNDLSTWNYLIDRIKCT